MEHQTLHIGDIKLKWSEWYPWDAIKTDDRKLGGVNVPNKNPGVYEVRRAADDIRLTIGKASNLRHRIRQALVKGKSGHSSGKKMRGVENTAQLYVRWAETTRPAAAEEELHRLYYLKHGKNPEYTLNAEYKPPRGQSKRPARAKTHTP